ncbi:MAG: NUDIX domain-containing protein [Candidatus Roizmanbacteria bacterium]
MDEVEFKYCPVCSNLFEKISTFSLQCNKCGYQYYVNPKPCNAVILKNSDGNILLVKRKFDPFKGSWDLPGGFIEPNESMEDSIHREIMEELGIKVDNIHYLKSYSDRYFYKSINYFTIGFVCTGTIKSSNIEANDDVEEIQFFNENDIPFDQIAFQSVKQALVDLFSLNKSISSKESK